MDMTQLQNTQLIQLKRTESAVSISQGFAIETSIVVCRQAAGTVGTPWKQGRGLSTLVEGGETSVPIDKLSFLVGSLVYTSWQHFSSLASSYIIYSPHSSSVPSSVSVFDEKITTT